MEYYLPRKIYCPEKGADLKYLYKKTPFQIDLNREGCVSFGKGDALVLDFGKEMIGGLRILTCTVIKDGGLINGRVRITFGESYFEALSSVGTSSATNDHTLRDVAVELTSYSDMTFCDTAYRFVRVEFLDDAEYLIRKFFGECKLVRRKPTYKYAGKDLLTAKIFDVAKRTIDFCSSGRYVWDGVKRDRLVWVGDIYPEMLALVSLYGKSEKVEKSLDFVKNATKAGEWINGVPSYSAWWVISLLDYAELTGKTEYLFGHISDVKEIIGNIDACVSSDGEMHFGYYFMDWPTHGKPDEKAGVRAINIIAAKKTAEIFAKYGVDFPMAKSLLAKLKSKNPDVESAKQAIALKYFAYGEVSEREKSRLTENGCEGFSTYMSYFILSVISELYGTEKAAELMKEYYGAMLDCGATTFWEDFDIRWVKNGSTVEYSDRPESDIHGLNGDYCYKGYRHSLCHGWSTGVIRFIYERLS